MSDLFDQDGKEESATPEDLAFILDVPLKQIQNAIKILLIWMKILLNSENYSGLGNHKNRHESKLENGICGKK